MKYFSLIFLLLCIAVSNLQAATLSASVDRTHLNNNETLALTLHYDEDSNEEPDTRALEQQFSIMSRNRASSVQLVNGSVSSSTTWYFELLPRKTGTLLIPSFNIDGNYSDAITVEVGAGPNTEAQAQQSIYTETDIDKADVLVQQQAIVTWRLVSKLNISDPQFLPPQIDNVLVQDLGNRQYQRSGADGGIEQVIEQRYALFPQQSGEITIPVQQFQVTVNTMRRSSMGIIHPGRTPVRLNTDEKQLHVLPARNTQQSSYWLPARHLEITQEITGTDRDNHATAGSAFTRIIRIRAVCLSAEQLPALDLQASGIKVYSEKPELNNTATIQGVIGLREERAAIIATQAGKLVLPAIHIPWYDTDAAQWRDAVLPETTLEVLPATATAANSTTPASPTAAPARQAPTPTSSAAADAHATAPTATTTTTTTTTTTARRFLPDIWQIACALLLLVWLLTMAYVYRLQQRSKNSTQPTGAGKPSQEVNTKTLQRTTSGNDLKALHRELLAWAQQQSANRNALQDPSVNPLFQALEKHLYGNGPAPDPQALKGLPEQLQALAALKSGKAGQASQLENLYR